MIDADLIYVDLKTGYNDNGPAWIGFAGYSKTGATLYFNGKAFKSLKGLGISANYYEVETDHQYWISGVKRNGWDRHWAGGGSVQIDGIAIEQYLAETGFSELPRDLIPTKLSPSEFSQEHHKRENKLLDTE